jgi:hypothetical protein
MADVIVKHEGGCLCGAVRYAFAGDPLYSANCHCRSCQRAIGAGVVTWTAVNKVGFEVTKGEIKYCESSPGMLRGFCATCGSSLEGHGDDWDEFYVTSASLDDPTIADPVTNVYLDHQQPWVKIDETLRCYEKFPE